jgi:hypothetical protein
MSSHHYSHYSQTVKTKGKNKFQSYNTEEGYERKSVNTLYNKYNKYNKKNYFRTDEKRNYLRQIPKSPNSSYRRSTPSNLRKPEPKGAKMKSIDKLFKHKTTFSFDSQNNSFYSPIKNERSKEKSNHKFVSSYYTNKKKDKKKVQNLPKKFNHNRNQTIGNDNLTYTQKLLSPKKLAVQTPKKYEGKLKTYTKQSKVYQSQTINKPYSKFSRNNAPKTQIIYKNQTSSKLNNSYTELPPKCKYCCNYLIEQKVYKRSVPKEEIQIFKTNTNLRSKSGKKSNLKKSKVTFSSKKGNLYDTFSEGVGKVETTIKNNRYDPNYYVNENGTSVFKEPKKTSTLVKHYVKNNNQGKKFRYYNDAKVFGKKNNMAYYEINESPQKKVFISPIYI